MSGTRQGKVLVLDAMGVLYQASDDVEELLIPYITSINRDIGVDTIKRLYIEASLGRITNIEFWNGVHVPPENEDDYLSRHQLNEGLLEFLERVRHHVGRIVCLSNDVSEWSIKLRRRFGLERYISGWFISADVGIRKPDQEIYIKVSNYFQHREELFFFFDDTPRNVVAAERIGWYGYVFNLGGKNSDNNGTRARRIVSSFDEVESIITGNR